jgi:hypothetical protein
MIEEEYIKDEGLIVEKFQEIKKYIPLTITDILNMKLPKDPFLVEGLIPHRSITVIAGKPGSYKSWTLLHLAKCVASGKPMFGKFKTKRGGVLLIDGETGIDEIQKRVKLMKFRRKTPIDVFSLRGIKVDNPRDLNEILELVKAKRIELVILDPFGTIHSKIENSAEDMQKVMEAFQKIVLNGATVVFVHHHRKGIEADRLNPSQSVRGSSVILDRPDSHLEVKKEKETQTEIILTISQRKSRKGRIVSPFQVRMMETDGKVFFEFVGEHDEERIKLDGEKKQVLGALKELKKAGVDDLYKKLDGAIGKNRLGEILKELKSEGKINSKKVEHGKEVFWIKENI